MRAEQALNKLKEMLDSESFDYANPDAFSAWQVFKKFVLNYHADCEDDSVLVQWGHYGRSLFTLNYTRQFIFPSDAEFGSDDDYEQLSFDFNYKLNPELIMIQGNLWSGDDLNEFFVQIESKPEFRYLTEQCVPFECKIDLDHV